LNTCSTWASHKIRNWRTFQGVENTAWPSVDYSQSDAEPQNVCHCSMYWHSAHSNRNNCNNYTVV